MTDRGLAALAAALHAKLCIPSGADWRLRVCADADEGGIGTDEADADAILGEHGVFLPDGLPPLSLTIEPDGSISKIAGGPLEDSVSTAPTRGPTWEEARNADFRGGYRAGRQSQEAEIERPRAALSAFVTWWDAAPFVTTDEAIAEHIDVLRVALARTGGSR